MNSESSEKNENNENNENDIKEVIVQENQLQDSLIPLSEPVVQPQPEAQPEPQNQPQNQPVPPNGSFGGQEARGLAQELLHTYFTSQSNPLTKHHIDSYDQFLQRDLISIIRASNPILILKEPIDNTYKYSVEIYIGGPSSTDITIGSPSITLNQGKTVRLLYPNEARLRNLTYAVQIEADIHINIKIITEKGLPPTTLEPIIFKNYPLCSLPLMLHSRYCLLNSKPVSVLREMGECPQDQGGYFIVGGSEKVLITRQEGAFNTLYISPQPNDDKILFYSSMKCLNTTTREVRSIAFYWTRERTVKLPIKKTTRYYPSLMEVSIPFIRKPVPLFVLFRALGVQTDKAIMHLIFPDFDNPETKYLQDLLIPSMNAAFPFLDTYSALQYMKSLTKGFTLARVLDTLTNHFFAHIENRPGARPAFLAECVRQILRVVKGVEAPPSKDDTRNQRLLSSGFLTQMLFQSAYVKWVKAISFSIDEAYNYNKDLYSGEDFKNIFQPGNVRGIFKSGMITDALMKGFKGKWNVGGNSEEAGVLQSLSRLSYLDFMSHCRRVVLDFDKTMKISGPRRLNPSQFGYFCPSETPSGGNIGVTKNLTMLTSISTSATTTTLTNWLFSKGTVTPCSDITPSLATVMVPVFLNGGLLGYTGQPKKLTRVLRLLKRTACLPPFSSSGFNISQRRVFIYMDEGRPVRPMLLCEPRGTPPVLSKFKGIWKNLILGTFPGNENLELSSTEFLDPLEKSPASNLDAYIELLTQYQGCIEYIDPYEQNEAFIANMPEHILPETTHMEVHPSTILGLLGVMIPYPNHNQSPRNQLSASQSKQGLSLYATNWFNRFDNSAHVLCYGEDPLSRTLYQDYVGDGKMSYGMNIVLAMGIYTGYNQEDGIILNKDALQRGLFRSISYRSYEAFEEDDPKLKTKIRIANPTRVPGWLDINVGLDYSKLDDTGIVKVGEYVDQDTVIVSRYTQTENGKMKDSSVTPQVWTRGRVEKVVVTVSNTGLRLVKIRIVQDRTPELGDKFSNRHGQKGTMNCALRAQDMPHTENGIIPDMIMNPHAIPSRMTIGQLLESLGGKVGALVGAINNATPFMNEGSPHEDMGVQLENLGFEKYGNELLYNGQTGDMMDAQIFIGNVYTMRLKHMTEDKWNARADGRKEQKTHQPTGGRGNEGGLKIGEMERDAITGHGIVSFIRESMMERSDGTSFFVCNGCGTIPIYNEKEKLFICSLCDGPIQFSGDSSTSLEPIPPSNRSSTTFSKVEMPYATKLFIQELGFFLNVGLRMLTTYDVTKIGNLQSAFLDTDQIDTNISLPLPDIIYPELNRFGVPEEDESSQENKNEEINVENIQQRLGQLNIQQSQQSQESHQNQQNQQNQPLNQERKENKENNESANISSRVESLRQPEIQSFENPEKKIQLSNDLSSSVVAEALPTATAAAANQQSQNQNQSQVIHIDTSAPAMRAENLVEPVISQTEESQLQQLNQQHYQQPNAGQGSQRPQGPSRRRIRKAPQQGQEEGQQLRESSYMSQAPTEGGYESEEKQTYSAPLNIIKLN